MPVRDIIVNAIGFVLMALILSLVGLGVYIGARVFRSAERADRQRYLLAGLSVVGLPIFFAAIARSLMWMHERSEYVAVDRAGGELVAWSGNLLAVIACSASAAFVLPFRSPRERGFAIVGFVLAGFMIYCVLSG